MLNELIINTVKSFKGLGKRKSSIANVLINSGYGLLLVNKKEASAYFASIKGCEEILKKPMLVLGLTNSINVSIKVSGGGLNSQIEACQLGIATALSGKGQSEKKDLENEKLLLRDLRKKERKKYGLLKARKAPQYSKR